MQDLFQSNSSTASSLNTVVASQNSVVVNPFAGFGAINFSQIALNLNQFALCWSVGLSFLLVADFFFYYRLHSDGNMERHAIGVKSIRRAIYLWLRYLPGWIFYTAGLILPNLANFFEIGAIVFFIIKLWGDLLTITKISDYFPWFNKITAVLNKILSIYKTK